MRRLSITRTARGAGVATALAAVLAAAPALAQGSPPPAAPAFTTSDLARLCGPASDDANALAMRPACYAAIVAVGQTHAILTNGRNAAHPVFCLPADTPSMDRISADFVSWAAANQQYASARASEGVLRFAAAKYPCPTAAPSRRR